MYFEHKLPDIFEGLSDSLNSMAAPIEENNKFIDKVMRLIMVWNDWVIFDGKFLMGLEALLNKRTKSNSDNIFEYDTSTQLGIKLKCLEEDLKSQSIIELEKICKTNGLPLSGSKNKLIERLLNLEEYRFKLEKSNNYSNNGSESQKKQQSSSKKTEKTGSDAKSYAKNSMALVKSMRHIDNKNLGECSGSEIDGFCKNYLSVLKLLQSRAEKFNVADIDGIELDEIDEVLYEIKKKLNAAEENIDGIFFFKKLF